MTKPLRCLPFPSTSLLERSGGKPLKRAGGIDDSLLQEIRDRTNIVSVVGDYVSIKKAGNHYKGLCPFHNERTPSFTVNEGRQVFYCFGCQTGGDAVTFLRELHGYSFVEAIRSLAERAGIHVPEPTFDKGYSRDPSRPSKQRVDDYFKIGKLAKHFFKEVLQTSEGQACQRYLHTRGITPETTERYGLGFAPDRWDGLTEHLQQERVHSDRSSELGLIAARKSGQGFYDRFRNRLMFPIHNLGGEVIAFSGRTLSTDKEVAKYINSPESPIYTKGNSLFGLHEARKAMRACGHVVVVEGNVDLLRLAQDGLQQVVAPLGTALTDAQCRLIKRFVPRVILLYDGDRAGRTATIKAVGTALAEGLQVDVAVLPDNTDPDTFVQDQGFEALTTLIDKAQAGFEYVAEQAFYDSRARDSQQGKIRAIDQLAPLLSTIPDPRERGLYRRIVAQRLDLSELEVARFVKESIRRQSRRQNSAPETRPQRQQEPPPPPRELALMVHLLLSPECCPLFLAHEIGTLLTHATLRETAENFASAWDDDNELHAGAFAADLDNDALRARVLEGLLTPPSQAPIRDFQILENQLRSDALKRQRRTLRRELETEHDATKKLQILVEENRINQELEQLDTQLKTLPAL